MPQYRVTFPAPVVYLQGHRAERSLTDLVVTAPHPAAALIHAARVVTGDVEGAIVEDYQKSTTVPTYEVVHDMQQNFPELPPS